MNKKSMTFLLGGLLSVSFAMHAIAQDPVRHELIRGDLPPGEAAHFYQQADPSLIGHIQPVQLIAPANTTVEVGDAASSFGQAQATQMTVAMGIGYVYRFKLSNLPLPEAAGKTLYPSIEVIGKLKPPAGLENDFPVQVVVTRDDIDLALTGRMVTRVIYLEDSRATLPHLHIEAEQPSVDVSRGQDPLRAAEQLGRPMAILRMGSRVPMENEVAEWFTFGVAAPQVLPNPRPANLAGLNERELQIVRAMEQAEAEAEAERQSEIELRVNSEDEDQQVDSVSRANFNINDADQSELSQAANQEVSGSFSNNIGTISQTVEQPEQDTQAVITNTSIEAGMSTAGSKPQWIPVEANAVAEHQPQNERPKIKDMIPIRVQQVNVRPPAPSMLMMYFEPLEDSAQEAQPLAVQPAETQPPEVQPLEAQPPEAQPLVAPMVIRRPNEL